MLLFGIAGVLASFGLWWMLYRYGKSIGDAADVPVRCTQHCGGVDGPYLVGLICSACLVLVGLVVTVVALSSRRQAASL